MSDTKTITLTVSLGIAEIDASTASIDELLANCDEALYRAKQSGRNRTMVYDPQWKNAVI
jgi:diguanylate cyclase (GGDEF)-like protein